MRGKLLSAAPDKFHALNYNRDTGYELVIETLFLKRKVKLHRFIDDRINVTDLIGTYVSVPKKETKE